MQFLALNVENLLRGLWASLCQLIYRILAWLYELFMNISRVEILTTKNIQPIYQRVTMILTIVMVFYVTFEAVKYVVQPDNFTDKEKGGGKLTLKMILVVILIAFVPNFFTWAYTFQNVIFDNQVFSKIILGKQSVNTEEFGRAFSANILGMFYYPDEATWGKEELTDKNHCEDIPCATVVNANLSALVENGELPLMQVGLTDGDKIKAAATGEVFQYYIHFDGLFAVLVGAFICYVLILYCIDVGVRVIQLTFLQIMAPIPIIGYLSPKKDGIFQKWVKQCITTYLDLFIRTGIIYFGLLICQVLSEAYESETLFNNIPGDTSTTMKVFIYIALILGILLFIQKAPKMLGELFPKMGAASGNFGLKPGERMAPIAARAAGAALGSTRAIGGAVSRGINRATRNRANGAKSIFTKEGREQFKERNRNRKNASDLDRDLRTSAGMRKRVSDDTLERGKKRVRDAHDAYKKAIGTSNEGQKKAEFDKASAEYRKLVRTRSGITDTMLSQRDNYAQKRDNLKNAQNELQQAIISGDQDRISKAQQRTKQAENEFKVASSMYKNTLNAQKAENGVGHNWASMISANEKNQKNQQRLDEANQKYQQALASGDEQEIQKAEQEVDEATKMAENSQQNVKSNIDRFKDVREGNKEQIEANVVKAEEQIAIDNNQRYSSAVGAAITGAVSGGITGIKAGSKATKLGEIIPKAKEGWQKDIKNIQSLNKYYDNGGATGVQGAIERTTAKIEQSIGIDTAYERRMLDSKKYDNQIKDLDAKMVLTKDVSSTVGSGEDRLKSKVSELKTTASPNTIKTGLKDSNGIDIYADVEPNETIGALTRKYDAKAAFASNEAESAAKRAEEHEKEAQIAEQQSAPDAQAKRALADKYRKEAEQKAVDARNAEFAAEQVKKNAARAAYTQILNHPDPEHNKDFDQVAVQAIRDAQRSISLASKDPRLRDKVYEKLISSFGQSRGQTLYQAFITGNIKTFDDIDDIKTAVINAENEYARDKKDKQEAKRITETNARATAEKVASDYAGNSGK